MKIILTGGFLGSGKTTAIQHACNLLLKEKVKVAVITNDQGEELVDSKYLQNFLIPVKEVTKGCFCCNYNSLLENIRYFSEIINPQIIFAESVGSCTDLVATIAKPLAEMHPELTVNISVFVDSFLLYSFISGKSSFINDSVRYIFKKQMEEADILILNKTDLLNPRQLEEIKEVIQTDYPQKKMLLQNSLQNKDTHQWLNCLETEEFFSNKCSLDIDYAIYGDGEAKLAWLDADLLVATEKMPASKVAVKLAETIYEKIGNKNYAIGYLKFLVTDGSEQFKMSYTASSNYEEPIFNMISKNVSVLINARVETTPEILEEIMYDAINEVAIKTKSKIQIQSLSAFKPGFPRPTYRIAN